MNFSDLVLSKVKKNRFAIKKDAPFASIIKARALPIGTKRKHGKVLKVKTAEGWVPVGEEKTAPKEEVSTKEAPKKEDPKKEAPKKESALDKQRSQIESQSNALALGMTSSDMLDEKALQEKFKDARAESLKIDIKINEKEGKETNKKRWQPHANGPPPLPKFTLDSHKNPDGTVKEDRRKAHDAIVAKYVDRVEPTPEGEKPVAIMMMGGPGSGKSSLLRDVDFTKFVHCDSDQMKNHIPEYHAAISSGARDAAYMVHSESALIGDRIRDTTIEQGKNLILDGTGRWFDHYKEVATHLKERGYHVQLIMPHITYDQAKPRVESRAEVTGRFVPDEVLQQAYEAIPRNFEALASLVDEAQMFDNGGPFGSTPKQVLSYKGGKRTDHDAEYMEAYRKDFGDAEPVPTERPKQQVKKAMSTEKEPKEKPPHYSSEDVLKMMMDSYSKNHSFEYEGEKTGSKNDGVVDQLDDRPLFEGLGKFGKDYDGKGLKKDEE